MHRSANEQAMLQLENRILHNDRQESLQMREDDPCLAQELQPSQGHNRSNLFAKSGRRRD